MVDPFDLVERPQQVDEPLARRAAEIPRVDACHYALFFPKRRYMEKLPSLPLYFGARNQAK